MDSDKTVFPFVVFLRRREFMRQLFVVDSLDKQIQNEKELIHLASAWALRGGAILYLCGEY